MSMMYYLFELTKEKNDTAEELLFSNEKYLWYRLKINKFSLFTLSTPDRDYHFFFDSDNVFIPFNEGEEFIAFLKERGAKHIKYDLQGFEGNKNEIMVGQDGRKLVLRSAWISTGYEYAIYEKDAKEPMEIFWVPKSGKIVSEKGGSKISISLKHQGTSSDPVMKAAYKEMKSSKSYGCVFGIIFLILCIVGFYFLGQIINWIGGLIGFG